MHLNILQKKTRNKKDRWMLAVLLLFLGSAVVRGILGDFPKALRIYPDELRYVGIARSLVHGQGIRIHNLDSDFQKILYSICIMPAFCMESTASQIRAVGYLNSAIVTSSVIPVYLLCRKLQLDNKEVACVLVFWMTLPTLLVSMYFMSEVLYLPLSMWLIYCAWCAFGSEKPGERIYLNILLGILGYLAYLCKEIALYFVLSYLIICTVRIFIGRAGWKWEAVYLLLFSGAFMLCFGIMKLTFFCGMGNSYAGSNLSGIRSLELIRNPARIAYLLYALVYDTVFAVLGLGVFPVLIPLAQFDRNKKESWFFLFLLTAFLIGCAAIAYTITLPEEFGKRSPRQHLRYLEPFAIPFYSLMIHSLRQADINRTCQKRLWAGIGVFSMFFAVLGAGGGSSIADNSMLVYYEYFARFICRSDKVLLAVRLMMVVALGAGCWLLYKNSGKFLRWFVILSVMINLVNSAAGYAACIYRYAIDYGMQVQAAQANAFLHTLQGNILLITDEGWESEDSRLFDTYVDRDYYVAEIDMLTGEGYLEDAVLDLKTEFVRCDFPFEYYNGLSQVDYLIVRNDHGIRFRQETVDQEAGFPLKGYTLYKNRRPDEIWFEFSGRYVYP